MTVQAMKAGAVEFLTKPFKSDVLLPSVRSAVERSKTLLGREEETHALKARFADLTRRERDVMSLVVVGLLNKQVGSPVGYQRSHSKETSRERDAKDAGRISGSIDKDGGTP